MTLLAVLFVIISSLLCYFIWHFNIFFLNIKLLSIIILLIDIFLTSYNKYTKIYSLDAHPGKLGDRTIKKKNCISDRNISKLWFDHQTIITVHNTFFLILKKIFLHFFSVFLIHIKVLLFDLLSSYHGIFYFSLETVCVHDTGEKLNQIEFDSIQNDVIKESFLVFSPSIKNFSFHEYKIFLIQNLLETFVPFT